MDNIVMSFSFEPKDLLSVKKIQNLYNLNVTSLNIDSIMYNIERTLLSKRKAIKEKRLAKLRQVIVINIKDNENKKQEAIINNENKGINCRKRKVENNNIENEKPNTFKIQAIIVNDNDNNYVKMNKKSNDIH
jgi:hypothetical protein